MVNATCPVCAEAIPPSKTKRRKYCSRSCGAKASRRQNGRVCEVSGCNNPHGARGMCYSHYGTWHRHKHGRSSNSSTYTIVCIVCGTNHQASRPESKFCSDACKGKHYSATMKRSCKLPADHPVMVLIAEAREAKKSASAQRRGERERRRSTYEWRTARECPGCACSFTPIWTSNMICCSVRCSRRVARWRRNAAERDARGTFTWSEFMHIARRFDYRCAYCGCKPGRLDPDHVVPLSRGGHNSTTNLLPSCYQCNGDKRDLLLDEWAVDREARNKPPRATNWPSEDRRYWHLTQAALMRAA